MFILNVSNIVMALIFSAITIYLVDKIPDKITDVIKTIRACERITPVMKDEMENAINEDAKKTPDDLSKYPTIEDIMRICDEMEGVS